MGNSVNQPLSRHNGDEDLFDGIVGDDATVVEVEVSTNKTPGADGMSAKLNRVRDYDGVHLTRESVS